MAFSSEKLFTYIVKDPRDLLHVESFEFDFSRFEATGLC